MGDRLPPLVPVDLADPGPVPSYFRAMVPACPFVEPGSRQDTLFVSEVTPDCRTAADVHPRLFEQLVPQIERFRDARRGLADARRRLLVCHTVVLRFPPALDADVVRLLGWPNLLGWSLKHLYTPKEIVLGFVRRGVADRSAAGAAIPVAPCHAVVIRSRVASADGRFFPNNEAMLQAMMAADDDGGDVLGPLLGTAPDARDPQALRDDQTYQRLLRWWQTSLAKR